MSVMMVTSLGDIVVDLFTDRCPLTCKNFLKLCKIKYYNGCLFHTVQKDFTAQTGDPTGTGSGGDSIYKFLYGDQARFFGDEIHLDLKHSKTGTIAMASAGENLNASQFYITLRDDLDYLDGKHTVFGEVAEGLETLTRINEAYVDENSRPYKNIRIKHTYVLDDPFDDPSQIAELIPDASPEGKPKEEVVDDVRLEDDWVPMDEQLGTDELEEVLRSKEAHSRAVVLESIGDIPDAEVKPPDNVLFVCKLNPVTEDEDLHTIFSRFGTVTSAEIIRDYKTGDSLCYAFIEFEDNDACEQAYFKMDNALIDDRRIHVDFSQSVAKLWSQYRRKDQMGKGRGCYKCGSVDHIAKDCTGDTMNTQENPKYIMKDGNAQHGGDDNSRYEMVFDGDAGESPKHSKKRYHEEKISPYGGRQRGYRARDESNGWRDSNGGRERGDGARDETDGGRDSYRGSHRGRQEEARYEKRHGDDSRDRQEYEKKENAGDRHGNRREETRDKKTHGDAFRDRREYKESAGDRHRDRREVSRHEKRCENDYSDRDNREKREYKKEHAGDRSRGDRKDERDFRKRSVDDDRGDRKDERDSRKISVDERCGDKKDERDSRKRSVDDDHRHHHRDDTSDRDRGRRH